MAEKIPHESTTFVPKIPDDLNRFLLCISKDGNGELIYDWRRDYKGSIMDHNYKIILIGDLPTAKAKTHIVQAFVEKELDPINDNIRDVNKNVTHAGLEGENVKLTIRHIKIAEKEALQKTCFEDARGVMLVYDIDNYESFEDVKHWVDKVYHEIKGKALNGKPMEMMIIGNKIWKPRSCRKVPTTEAGMFATEHGFQFYEVVGNELTDVYLALQKLAQGILDTDKLYEIHERVQSEPTSITEDSTSTSSEDSGSGCRCTTWITNKFRCC